MPNAMLTMVGGNMTNNTSLLNITGNSNAHTGGVVGDHEGKDYIFLKIRCNAGMLVCGLSLI